MSKKETAGRRRSWPVIVRFSVEQVLPPCSNEFRVGIFDYEDVGYETFWRELWGILDAATF